MAIIFLFCWGLIAPQEYFHTVFNSAPNNQERFPLEPSYTWSHLLCGNDQQWRKWLILALSCPADILDTSASFASKNHQLWVQFQLDKGLWIVLIVHWKLIDDLQCRQHLTELSRNFSCHRFTKLIFQPLIFFRFRTSIFFFSCLRGAFQLDKEFRSVSATIIAKYIYIKIENDVYYNATAVLL